MNVNAVKHQAKLQEWKGRVAECRSSGMSVKHWCEENDCSPRTYYRWEQEILGKVRQITKAAGAGRASCDQSIAVAGMF